MDELTLKALGDPKRYNLLRLLSERAYCVGALAVRSGMSESAVSQHLKILREAGLVSGEKRGYYTHYQVNKEALQQVIAQLSALLQMDREPCDSPFHGCPEAAAIRCKAYIAQENNTKE
ncbi:MAG: metalloregulator ArsR/SmtB family transcription factor [Eubacteriales bacterium]|nr:metalloregulator ArsR/SmtB family transcription factor [Eubacteriales bacterium]